jgi:protein-L-isoaspartate(D-aspartate) O-methyltransferase
LESDAGLAEMARATIAELGGNPSVKFVVGPLQEGHAASGPFNAIIVEGAVEQVPQHLIEQLVEGGKLVTVLREERGRVGRAILLTRAGNAASKRILFDANTPLLPDFEKARTFAF